VLELKNRYRTVAQFGKIKKAENTPPNENRPTEKKSNNCGVASDWINRFERVLFLQFSTELFIASSNYDVSLKFAP
jgi:hypothetical protein